MRAVAACGALLLVGCAEPPPPPAPRPPPKPPAVAAVMHHGADRSTGPDAPFFVVLTRPVDPAPGALALLDDDGATLPGETTWLAPQLVAFYPKAPLAHGLGLHLRLAVALRTRDGLTLSPAEIAADATPPLEMTPDNPRGNVAPLGAILLSGERLPPAAEIEQLGVLSATESPGDPIAFEAHVEGTRVSLVAKRAFPPGADLVFAWKDGVIAKTSVGRVHLEPLHMKVWKGFELRVGEARDRCEWTTSNAEGVTWTCKGDVVHLVFSTPVSDEAIAERVHPPQPRSTTGDLRGHRLEVTLGKKPVHVSIDGRLQDVFGQRLDKGSLLVLRKEP